MAQILILEEEAGPAMPLRNSLQCHHQLHFVDDSLDAMRLLRTEKIDLIISRVHLDNSNLFEFIKTAKREPSTRNIPFLCFCEEETNAAKFLDGHVEHAAILCGADKYLVLERFRCNNLYDFDVLRRTIEECMVAP
ncbi:MAG TPA: hypothetical protein V6D22_07475 [Candidatus Obscuribacterales bacterium]